MTEITSSGDLGQFARLSHNLPVYSLSWRNIYTLFTIMKSEWFQIMKPTGKEEKDLYLNEDLGGMTLYKRDLNAIKMTSPNGAVTYSPLNSLPLNAGTFLILRPIYCLILCNNFCTLDCGKQQGSSLPVPVSVSARAVTLETLWCFSMKKLPEPWLLFTQRVLHV